MLNKINIIIADDHPVVREGLKKLFETEKDITVVAEAVNGEDCLEKVRGFKPDVLLLDISMPKLSGLDALPLIKKVCSKTKVIIVTVHDEPSYFKRAVELDADGYILKDSDFEIFLNAVHSVFGGNKFYDKSFFPFYGIMESSSFESEDPLTNREKEILIYIADGYMNKEIASKMNISEKTVKNHVSNLFKKINVNDRTQAAVYAIKNNYVEI